MRLSQDQISLIKETILSIRPSEEVYLFGCRTDIKKRGGDIDILILTEEKLNYRESLRIERTYGKRFGHQKIDLACFSEEEHPFKALALVKAVIL